MARPKPSPKTAGKKRAARKKPGVSRSLPKIPVFTILRYLAVLLFFMLSIAAVFYVVFFQVVVAAEPAMPGSTTATAPEFAACPARGAMEEENEQGRLVILPADAGGQPAQRHSHAE